MQIDCTDLFHLCFIKVKNDKSSLKYRLIKYQQKIFAEMRKEGIYLLHAIQMCV